MRMTADGEDADGAWYSVWFTDIDTGETLWVGSLRFPLVDGDAIAVGQPVLDAGDIWSTHHPAHRHTGMVREHGASRAATGLMPRKRGWGYSGFQRQPVPNADVQYDDGRVHLRIGGDTEQVGEETVGYREL